MNMIVDVNWLHVVEEIEGTDIARWRVEAYMMDGTVMGGTIIGDGYNSWEDDTFTPDWDSDDEGSAFPLTP